MKFKKGSAAAKRHMAKVRAGIRKRFKKVQPKVKKRRVKIMARKKKTKYRYVKRVKKHMKRNRTTYGLLGQFVAAFGYGTIRQPMSDMTKMAADRLGIGRVLGEYSDEAMMTGVSFLVAKNSKGWVKQIAKSGMQIEGARLGAKMNLLGNLNVLKQSSTGKPNGLLF